MSNTTASVTDELAIRNLIARYADAVNCSDAEAWGNTWAEDGFWSLLGFELTGREGIVGFWQQAMSGFEFAIMMNNQSSVEIDGDTATGRTYLSEYTRDKEGNKGMALGIYKDQYIKVDGEWLFKSRIHHMMYQGPEDLSGNYAPVPA